MEGISIKRNPATGGLACTVASRTVLCFAVLTTLGPPGASLLHAFQGTEVAKADFNRDIRPILAENCFKCHGPDEAARKSELRLDNRDGALRPAKSGKPAIVPGAPESSELLGRITSKDTANRMPPPKTGKSLSDAQIEALRRWVKQGAPYAVHWAYAKPVRPPIPEVKDAAWPKTDLDRFILARLERERLAPSRRAAPEMLARRAALGLLGLPPSPELIRAFAQDPSQEAYSRLVDQLLGDPAFGEHWARMWLDLARYADSAGYADDPPRIIWLYRDYVIKSFNKNKPFDRFTIEQIAGDMLPEADEEEVSGSAFHRNTMTNNEGGTDDEEFRNAAIVDRVNTTMAVWMGTSMGCAQCHSHKYDPISQQEYFRMFAIFNNSEDADRTDEAPVLRVYSEAQQKERDRLQAEIARLEVAIANPPSSTTSNAIQEALTQARKHLDEQGVTLPVMRELPEAKRRQTSVQLRGNFKMLGETVTPGLPSAFPPLPQGAKADRLGLAKWLVDSENPLTARVLVNRLWEQMFGVGIVRTTEEFGTQGESPNYPELLDYLATEMVAQHWDIKKFLKMVVTSATYQQSSAVSPSLLERDPENLLLARGPRFRMSAEMVRDQALFVSGLLSRKMFGPPIRPPQPALGLSAAFGGGLDWKTSDGEDKYRRGVYIEWRRTNPYASMATFDAPNREVCTLRRPRSNTPLQALVTLNDPVYFEAAQALGRRIARTPGAVPERIGHGFNLCLCRRPSTEELARLVSLYEDARGTYATRQEMAKTVTGTERAEDLNTVPQPDLAAFTVVANVLLNLDEMLMPP
jgi:hypothetical protein